MPLNFFFEFYMTNFSELMHENVSYRGTPPDYFLIYVMKLSFITEFAAQNQKS